MSRDRELVDENREVYEWVRDNGHSSFLALATECDEFVQGKQWDPAIKAALARRRKPHLTVNKVMATVATLMGEYLLRRGDISFRPSTAGDPNTAKVIDKLWLNFTQSQSLNWLEMAQFVDGVIRSRGFLDLRVDFDESMRGEPAIAYLNSKDVGLYPGDFGADPDNWTGVLLSKWMAPREIAEIYGVSLNDVVAFGDAYELSSDYSDWKKDSFGSIMYESQMLSREEQAKYKLLRVLERQEWEYKTVPCFVDIPTGEVREIPEAWDDERIRTAIAQFGYHLIRRRVKKIRWVTSVGDILLHNSVSPLRHFTPIPYFPFLIGGTPVGIIEHLRDPQNLLNKTLSQELHIVAGIANSGYTVKKGALTNMTTEQLQERGGEDGIVIEVGTNVSDVVKMQPNQVPTGLDRLSYKAREVMQEVSLVNDSMQGLNRADEAGKAIERKAMSGSTALSPIYASLDHSRRILGRNWLDIVQQFITEERVYFTTARARTAQPEQTPVNQPQPDGSFLNDLTVGEYAVTVTDVQARDSYDMNQFDIMMQMIRNGAPIPWSEAVNALTILENRDEIVEFLKGQEGRTDPTQEQQERAQLEKRLMEAQALDKESSAQVKMAQAQKSQMQAAKEAQPDSGPQLEMAKAQQDAQLKAMEAEIKRQEDLQKAALDARMAEQQLQMAREKHEQDMVFAQEKHRLEMEKLRGTIVASLAQNELKMEAMEKQAALKREQSGTKQEAKQ